MEQYIHTLIPVDSSYAATPAQVEAFIADLLSLANFRLVSGRPFQRGLRVSKPFARIRRAVNAFTGETEEFSVPEFIEIGGIAEILPLIENLDQFGVSASGEWSWDDPPLVLFTTDGEQFKENYNCEVRCERRSAPVSTSAWDIEAGPNVHNVPRFGSPCASDNDEGIFPNPWTGEAIEVPHAGCARFWIEFEFGKFLYPKVEKNFDALSHSFLAKVEACFQTKFVQACRFW
jgi:hypothetical protein